MRYRPFGLAGQAVSVLTLAVDDSLSEAGLVRLVYAALEAGINAFELQTSRPDVARALGKALLAVERQLVLVSLRLRARGLMADGLVAAVEEPLLSGRLGRFDALILEDDGEAALALQPTVAAAQAAGRVGVAGVEGHGAEAAMASGGYRLFSSPYNLASGWAERNRLKVAMERGAVVVGRDSEPPAEATEKPPEAARGFLGLGRRTVSDRAVDPFAFMHGTPGWSAEEICLAHALLEPSLATIVVRSAAPDHIERLAQTPDRELPTGLSAQIEMARFAVSS